MANLISLPIVLSTMPYQVCYRGVTDTSFRHTGISVVIQADVRQVEINNVYPNSGITIAVPRVRGSTLKFMREVPGLGYRQQVQLSSPLMMFSFDDADIREVGDVKCEPEECPPNTVFYNGYTVNPRVRTEGAALGTAKSLPMPSTSDSTSYARMDAVIDSGKYAFTIEMFFKAETCPVNQGCQQGLFVPIGQPLLWPAGSVALYYLSKGDNNLAEFGIQVQIPGYQDIKKFPENLDTVYLNYPGFDPGNWYHIAVSYNGKGDGVPLLIVNGVPWANPNAVELRGDATLRFGPVAIGALVVDQTVEKPFRGQLDELAVFDTALSASAVSLHYNRSAFTSVEVSRSGNLYFVQPNATCENFSLADANVQRGLMPFRLDVENILSKLAVGRTELFEEMAAGSYQLCVSLRNRPFFSTGVNVMIQDALTAISVNGASSALGLRSGLVQGSMSIVEYYTKARRNMTDSISFISMYASCTNTQTQNTLACTTEASGHLTAPLSNGIVRTFESNMDGSSSGTCPAMQTGQYQVCYRPAGTSVWIATGVSVHVQGQIRSLFVNNVNAGGGTRAFFPRIDGNTFTYQGNATATTALLAFTTGVSVMGDKRSTPSEFADLARAPILTIISPGLDCNDPLHNPSTPTLNLSALGAGVQQASGYLDTQYGLSVGTIDQSLAGLGPPGPLATITYISSISLKSDSVARVVSVMPEGLYQICAALQFGAGTQTYFVAAGISIYIQSNVTGISVNFVRPALGLRVAFPAVIGNYINVHKGSGTTSSSLITSGGGILISVIPRNKDCNNVADNPECTDALRGCSNVSQASGYLRAETRTLLVTGTSTIANLPVGAYQLCFFETTGDGKTTANWIGAGIGIAVQRSLTAIRVNSIASGKGLRAAVPQIPGNVVDYLTANVTSVHRLALFSPRLDCHDATQTTSATQIQAAVRTSATGFVIPALTTMYEMTETSVNMLTSLSGGLYQVWIHVCVRV
jgi:hypothetical protein